MPGLKSERGMPGAARFNTRHMIQAALFAALLAVFSQLAVPMVPVPMNLALLAVFLCTLVLEQRFAILSVGLYLLMGLLGLPVFAGFRGGPSVLFGPTGGYLLGYFLAAALIALLKPLADRFIKRILVLLLALLACYLPGTLWLMMLSGRNLSETLPLAVYPFLPGDGVKIVLAAVLAPRLNASLKRL